MGKPIDLPENTISSISVKNSLRNLPFPWLNIHFTQSDKETLFWLHCLFNHLQGSNSSSDPGLFPLLGFATEGGQDFFCVVLMAVEASVDIFLDTLTERA